MQEQVWLVEDDASLARSIADGPSDEVFGVAHIPADAPREARSPRSVETVWGRGLRPGDPPPATSEEDS